MTNSNTLNILWLKCDGSHKHLRWFTWSIAADGSLRVAWGKRRDGVEHFAWKKLSYAAPKQRTVTGVREESPATNPLGLTVEVSEAAPEMARVEVPEAAPVVDSTSRRCEPLSMSVPPSSVWLMSLRKVQVCSQLV